MADLRNDIERYHKGELTPAEMHALEKRALNDPFLADALEGSGLIDPRDFSLDLIELQTRLDEAQKTKKGWFSPLRIAASITVLLISSFILYTFLKSPEPVTLAKQEAKTPLPLSSGKNSKTDSAEIVSGKKSKENLLSLKQPSQAPRHGEKRVNQQLAETSVAPASGAGAISPSVQKIVSSDSVAANQPKAEDQVLSETKEKDREEKISFDLARSSDKAAGARKALQPGVSSELYKKVNSPRPTIRGKVTAVEDNSPIPGVNVVIKGTVTGTVSDNLGNYQITIDDPEQPLVYSFIGYATLEEKPGGRSNIDVQLTTDSKALSEVAVTGYGLSRDDHDAEDLPVKLAEPVGGKTSFDTYLHDQLQYPQEAILKKVEGKVTVEFTVKTDGSLTDFKIVRGIGSGCDEELIRLIKDGPKWLPNTMNSSPRDSKIRVRLKFSLPQ